ncbi:MAG: FixH family protein [Bryobacteraceae bacterium]
MKMSVAVLAALLPGACHSGGGSEMKEVASQNAGDLSVALLSESGDLKQGQNRFRIAFTRGSQPVDVGTVTVSSSMAMPGMAPMVAPIELKSSGETGKYDLTGEFAMSGAWQFEVRWNGPAGQGSTSFNTNVR